MLFIIGFVSSEFAYRFGVLVRYHDELSPFKKPSEGDPDNFSFRCKLLETPHLQKLWDWEQLQFDLCYYTEIVLALFFLSQVLNWAVYSICFLITGAGLFDLWASLAILLLILSGFLWFLAQRARKEKKKNFSHAVDAIKVQINFSE
jgi:small-conductance mechanosensitive channel